MALRRQLVLAIPSLAILSMKTTAILVLAIGLPMASSAAQQSAPRPFGFVAGVGVDLGTGNYGPGLQLGGLVSVALAPQVGVQFDANVQSFRQASGVVYFPCPPGADMCYATSQHGPLTLASASANLKYSAGAFTLLAGLGVYDVVESPVHSSYTRPGWNLGGRVRLGRAFLEVRRHQLIKPETTRNFVPITFGVRF